MEYQEALEWIHSIQPFGMNQGLERIGALLERVGNPHKGLKFIHIGGTNGKGSVAAYCASILKACGYRTGLYTSPYLEQFTNRIAVDGEDIPGRVLAEMVEQLKPQVEWVAGHPELGHPTEFEVVTTLALLYYSRVRPDIIVWEVGLGGRLDATNIIDAPPVTVITPISLDHTQVLGGTIADIAREKAAIIKRGSTLVCAPQKEEALAVIAGRCRQQQVPMKVAGKDFHWNYLAGSIEGQSFDYIGREWMLNNLKISLLGRHQVENAATAVAVMEALSAKGMEIAQPSLRQGLAEARWPGRLEIMGRNPLVVIDGAHNSGAMERLREAIQEQFHYRRLILLLGILGDKDINNILSIIVPLADRLVITRAFSPRAADPRLIAAAARSLADLPVIVEEDIADAFKKALSLAEAPDMICCAGSLYTISEVRRILKKF